MKEFLTELADLLEKYDASISIDFGKYGEPLLNIEYRPDKVGLTTYAEYGALVDAYKIRAKL